MKQSLYVIYLKILFKKFVKFLEISQENYKRNASVNITKLAKDSKLKSINNIAEKDKSADNFFKFLEEEPEILTNKPAISEENRRSSCKIIENSGVTRNLGDISGFQSYISTKPANSLLLVSENRSRASLINTSKLKDSENLPMNSVLNQVFPSVRYYKVNYEKQEKTDDLTENHIDEENAEIEKMNRKVTEIKEPIFKKTSFIKKSSSCSKEECEKLNEKLTENLMKEIMLEEKNNLLSDKKKETAENRNSKVNKKTIVNRPNREFSTFLDTFEKSKENLESLQKIPSKNDFLDEKNNEKSKNISENEQRFSKKKNSKQKIGITEDDFIRINSRTQINEKLIHASFKEKKDDGSAFDEDLMLSSVTSVGLSKEKPDFSKENNSRKPNNLFLGNFKDDKKSNYFKYEKKIAQEIDKTFDIYRTMNEETSKEVGKPLITKKKSQSINTKKK